MVRAGDREPVAGRVFGLDLLRALAIVLVVLVHCSPWQLGRIDGIGWLFRIDGVDLFFVLSGYLVGGLLLKAADRPDMAWRFRLLDFWQRRWLRTLPDYYVFLIINILLVAAGLAPGMLSHATPAYAVFMQDVIKPLDLFFWESWSLSVEEWFYLLFPIIMIAVVKAFRMPVRKAFLFTALVFIAVPPMVRASYLGQLPVHMASSLHVRRMVPTRLDAIGYGALAVWSHRTFPLRWNGSRWPLFLLGAVSLPALSLYKPGSGTTYMVVWFGAVSAAIAMLLPLLSSWHCTSRWSWPVTTLSRISYSIYLVHMPVLYLFFRWWPVDGVVPFVVYLMVVLASAHAAMRLIEQPFMRLRDKVGARIRKAATISPPTPGRRTSP